MKQTLLALVGAVAGGALGYNLFFWVADQGFYGLILPGGLLALGASIGKVRSVWLALVLGLAAGALGLYTEWRFRWDRQNLGYFFAHVQQLSTITLIMVSVGAILGFWVPFRRIDPQPGPSGKNGPK